MTPFNTPDAELLKSDSINDGADNTSKESQEKKNEKNKGKEGSEGKDVSIMDEVLGKRDERVEKANSVTEAMEEKIAETHFKVEKMKGETKEEKDAKNRAIEDDVNAAKFLTLTPDGKPMQSHTESQFEVTQSETQAVDTEEGAEEVTTATKNEEERSDATKQESIDASQGEGATKVQ